jgi:putative endonuclease
MAAHNELGHAAERRAETCLADAGWQILHRNWRWRRKEMDLVVRRGEVVAFVEVRARSSDRFGHPAETIGHRKRRDLATAARAWAALHGQPGDRYRFDVMTVLAGAAPVHIEGAWHL